MTPLRKLAEEIYPLSSSVKQRRLAALPSDDRSMVRMHMENIAVANRRHSNKRGYKKHVWSMGRSCS